MHKFLIHQRGDHVGVATSDIDAGENVVGIFMDDESMIEVTATGPIPLGHKVAVESVEVGARILKYGTPIGIASQQIQVGDYVHTHNLKSARW